MANFDSVGSQAKISVFASSALSTGMLGTEYCVCVGGGRIRYANLVFFPEPCSGKDICMIPALADGGL